MLTVLKIFSFELVAGVSVNYDKNISAAPSTRENAVPRFQIRLREMLHKSSSVILMER